jgi:hypothetical protein
MRRNRSSYAIKLLLCSFIVFQVIPIYQELYGQSGEIRDCNGKDITVDSIAITSSNNQRIDKGNCRFTQGRLSEYLNCIQRANSTIPRSEKLNIQIYTSQSGAINLTDLDLLKQDILRSNRLNDVCEIVAADISADHKVNTIDLCDLNKQILGIGQFRTNWNFYLSKNLNLSGIGPATDLSFTISSFPLSALNVVGLQIGNVNQATAINDTCVLLCKPSTFINLVPNETRKVKPEFFLQNPVCNFSNLELQLFDSDNRLLSIEVSERNRLLSYARLNIKNTSQSCTTKVSVIPCEIDFNLDIKQINTDDSTFVDIRVRNQIDISGYQFSLKFDSTKLKFSTLEKGEENGFNPLTDAFYDGKTNINFSRLASPSLTLNLANNARLFRVKFKRISNNLDSVTIDSDTVEKLFFDRFKNKVCAIETYTKENIFTCATDIIKPICKSKTLNKIINTNGNASFTAIELDDGSSDNCGEITYNASKTMFDCNDLNKVHNITFTVTDKSGNSSSCPVEVRLTDPNNYCACLNDVTKPVCKSKNISLFLDATGKANLTPTMINDGSFDACTVVTLQIEGPKAFDCNSVGKQTVNLVVADVAKNVSNCTAEVTVRDTIKPVCTIQPKNFYIGSNGQLSVTQNQLSISTTDNCNGSMATFNQTNYTCADIGNKTISATVRDVTGNSNTCSTQITIIDTIRPTCSIPTQTIYLGSNGQASLTQTQLNIVANDNCVGATTSFSTLNFNCSNLGVRNISATVRDVAGNTNSCTSQITVRDTIKPTCTVQPKTFYLDITGKVSVAKSQLNISPMDNCVQATTTFNTQNYSCTDLGSKSITVIVNDGSGNTNVCSTQISVKDTIKPLCKTKTINKSIESNGSVSISAIELNDNSSDNCENISFSASKTMFNCSDVSKTNIVTLTITDQSGNSSSCPVEVKLTDPNNYCACLNDVTKPVCKSKNISLFLDATGKANLTPAMINDGSIDACTDVTLQIEGPKAFDCNSVGKQIVNLVVTDVAKNVSNCTAEVSVTDTIKPVCTIQPKTFYIGSNGQLSVTQNQLSISTTDNCSGFMATFNQTNYTCADIGNKTISATVRDVTGNSNTCSNQITIIDTIRPTCSIPTQTIYLGSNGQVSLTQAQLNITANDNCAEAISTFNTINLNCSNLGVRNISATVRDVAGNTNSCTSQITIRDTIRPICIIKDTIVTATDGNGAMVSFNGRAIDNCIEGLAISYSQPSGQFFACGEYNITMTARDGSGNTSTCPFKLTVKDCDGCCRSESMFIDSTSREFQLESSLFQNNCKFILKPPVLSDCQYITALEWGDGTKSELMLSYKDPIEHFYQKDGTYKLCVTYSEMNGPTNCFTNTICNTIQIFSNCTFSRSVSGIAVKDILKVYPNPTNDIFYIEIDGSAAETIKSFTISNPAGQKFNLNANLKQGKLWEMDGSDLTPSVYFLSVELSNGISINKRVIKL